MNSKLTYHWKDKNKLNKDNIYLTNLYEKYLIYLSDILNKFGLKTITNNIGSFDKGIYFNIPIFGDMINYSWRPLTKDPGQKLIRKNNLTCLVLSVCLDNLDDALASHKLQEAINLAESLDIIVLYSEFFKLRNPSSGNFLQILLYNLHHTDM